MLKKIPVSDVRLGMHLHRLDGAWIDHPFWKTKFTLSDAEDLKRLRESAVPFVWIDPALGKDAADPAEGAPPSAAAAGAGAAQDAPAAEPTPARAEPLAPPPTDFESELGRAAAICKRGRSAVLSMFTEARLGKALDAEACLPLVEEISDSVERNPGAIVSLARLKTRDDYTYMHSVAVCALMVSLARQLGMDQAACRDAGLAGLLHDLGKAVMPIDILNKPDKLTDEEYAVMKTHPLRGHEMLLEGAAVNETALEVCLHHHERPDGKGYPHGLAGDELGLLARMGAVCDVYDAVTSDRPYKEGWDPAESIARMASWKDQFDGQVFKAFVLSLGIYPTGSLVRMASGRLAVVTEQNPLTLTSPWVKVFFSTNTQMHMTPRLVDLSRPSCNDRILGRESPAKWGFTHLPELWAGPNAPRAR